MSKCNESIDEPILSKVSEQTASSRNTASLKSFSYFENGHISYSNYDIIETVPILKLGYYDIGTDREDNVIIKTKSVRKINYMFDFENKILLEEMFCKFFNADIRNKVNSLGYLHKVGVLLYGREGCGKTTVLTWFLNKSVDDNNAIVIYLPEYSITKLIEFISSIRAIQDNPIVVVCEEVDSLFDGPGASQHEGAIKRFLDGDKSIDNSICFLTTNYIDKIPNTIKNRKSRVKYCVEVFAIKDIEIIRGIVSEMIGDILTEEEILEVSRSLVDKTVDEIKQFCIDKIMDIDSEKLKNTGKKKVGFEIP